MGVGAIDWGACVATNGRTLPMALLAVWAATAVPAVIFGYGFAGGPREFAYSLLIGVFTLNPVTWWLMAPLIIWTLIRKRQKRDRN